jgi:N-acetylglucosamine kinase-like BadF-type ATPase
VDIVLGIDSGGTWLRIAVADLAGRPLRQLRRPGGRQERGVQLAELAAEAMSAAAGSDRVRAGAGTNAYGLADAWRQARLGGAPFATMSEAVLACDPDHGRSLVVIAGTGSAAASIDGSREVLVTGARGLDRDGGCGMWLGRAGRAAAASARAGGPATVLADSLPGDDEELPYRDVAALAVKVDEACRDGDEVAAALCDTAAGHLLELVWPHDRTYRDSTIITVGSVVAPGTSVGERFRQRATHAGLTVGEHRLDLTETATRWARLSAR